MELKYPDCEKTLKEKNEKLLNELKSYLKSDDIIFDGFYPYYTQLHKNESERKKKILFIARESYDLDENYIEEIYSLYKGKWSQSINQYKFHRMLFKLAYGIIHDCDDWNKIPSADELVKDFATPNGISFAFMNLSKFSNTTGDWKSDWNSIKKFIDSAKSDTARNYFCEQIELLDPDIILLANIHDLSVFGEVQEVDTTNYDVHQFDFIINGKKTPAFNMWHFSAPSKSDYEHYYKPLHEKLKSKNL